MRSLSRCFRPAEREPGARGAGRLSCGHRLGRSAAAACQSSSASRWRAGSRAARRTPPPRVRLARHVSGLGDEALLRELGAALGADVPADNLGRSAGWRVAPASTSRAVEPKSAIRGARLAGPAELSTAVVYREADRLELRARPRSSNSVASLWPRRWSSARRFPRSRSCCTTISKPPPSHVSGDLRRARAGARGGRGGGS